MLLPPAGPARVLTLSTFVSSVGKGVYYASSVLFFTRSIGLSPSQIAFGLTAATFVGLTVNIPLGRVADKYDPRMVHAVFMVLRGACCCGLALTRSFMSFAVMVCLVAAADRGAYTARAVLQQRVFPPDKRVWIRAHLRATTNLAGSVGMGLAGVGLTIDTRTAYMSLIIGTGLSFVTAGVTVALTLPGVPAVRRSPDAPQARGLLDGRFMAFAILNGIFSLHFIILELGIPLWVAHHTRAPHWIVAVLLLTDTGLVTFLQVRLTRSAETLPGAVRLQRIAGLCLTIGCIVFAGSATNSAVLSCFVMIAAVVVFVVGGILQQAGSFNLAFSLAPEEEQGRYQGIVGLCGDLSILAAPSAIAITIADIGSIGWLMIGLCFAAVGVAIPAVVRWNQPSTPTEAPSVSSA